MSKDTSINPYSNSPHIFTTRSDNNIIGVPSIDPSTGRTIIKGPRLVLVSPGSVQGQLSINLFFMTGKPESVVLVDKPQMFYVVTDQTILNLYIEATTGLRVPGKGIEIVK